LPQGTAGGGRKKASPRKILALKGWLLGITTMVYRTENRTVGVRPT